VTEKALEKVGAENIVALGLVTQRSTNILWDRKSGKPVYNAITWQDARTADLCDEAAEKILLTKLEKGVMEPPTSIIRITLAAFFS